MMDADAAGRAFRGQLRRFRADQPLAQAPASYRQVRTCSTAATRRKNAGVTAFMSGGERTCTSLLMSDASCGGYPS